MRTGIIKVRKPQPGDDAVIVRLIFDDDTEDMFMRMDLDTADHVGGQICGAVNEICDNQSLVDKAIEHILAEG